MAELKRQKEDKYIKTLAGFAGLSYHSAKSLYHLMCKDKGAIELLNGCMLGDEDCLRQAKDKYNYYGKLKVLDSEVTIPADVANFQEAVSDVKLIFWAFEKIGDKERIQTAVKTAMTMIKG